MGNRILTEEEYNHLIETEDMYKRLLDKNERAEAHIKNLKYQLEETQRKLDKDSKVNINVKSKLLAERDELKKDRDNWRDWFYELRYALRKDEQLDESISCVRDIPSDVEMIEDLKKRAADSDCYKEMTELLKEKFQKTNELADSWKRDYERIRDQFIYPIYNILYPDNPNRDINVTDFINDIKNLKVYSEENGRMYEEIKKLRDVYASRGNDIDRLLSENKEKDKKISELESSRDAWSNTATARAEQVIEVTKDRDKWKSLYNSLSETCADYDKRCKEECEKKYRDEISKLQNIVTEKHVEIKRLKKEIINLSFDRATVKDIIKKKSELNQTISDQEVTIKALLITIKEMCKEENKNA